MKWHARYYLSQKLNIFIAFIRLLISFILINNNYCASPSIYQLNLKSWNTTVSCVFFSSEWYTNKTQFWFHLEKKSNKNVPFAIACSVRNPKEWRNQTFLWESLTCAAIQYLFRQGRLNGLKKLPLCNRVDRYR